MKKYIIVMLAALSMLSTSCSSDEGISESELIGKWYEKYSSVAPEDGYIFNKDHTGITFYEDCNWDFEWSLVGSTLTITHEPEHQSLDKSSIVMFNPNHELVFNGRVYTKNPDDCYLSQGGGSNDEPVSGNAPSSLVSKTLNLYTTDNSYWMGIVHKSGGKCMVDLNNGKTISSQYPPTYTYYPNGSKASYSLTFVTETYVPYYGSYTYSQFTENITLEFTSSSKGKYSGTQTNMNGDSKQISGTFQIK